MLNKHKPTDGPGLIPGSSEFRVGLGICAVLFVVALLARLSDTFLEAPKKEQPPETSQPVRSIAAARPVMDEQKIFDSHLKKLVRNLRAERDAEKREELLQARLADMDPSEIPSALAFLQTLGENEIVDTLEQRLVRRWAESNPQAAAEWLTQQPDGPVRTKAVDDIAIVWANQNVSDAAAWARQLPTVAEKQKALGSIAGETVRTEPIEAIRLAAELPDGVQRDNLVSRAAMEWTARDPRAAIEWAHQIPGDALRQKVLAGAITAWSDSNPVAAATLAVDELPAGRVQDDAVVGIAQRWAQQDPTNAAAWVEQFPKGDLRVAAIENVASIWSQKNPLQANQWRQDIGFVRLNN